MNKIYNLIIIIIDLIFLTVIPFYKKDREFLYNYNPMTEKKFTMVYYYIPEDLDDIESPNAFG